MSAAPVDPGAANLDDLLGLVDPRVGIVRELSRVSKGADEPNLPIVYHARLSHFDLRRGEESERSAAGKGRTGEQAMASALGEAVERYCASLYDPSRFVRASADELAGAKVRPAECVLYHRDQYAREDFAYREPDDAAEISWVEGRALPGGEPVHLPASLTFLSFVGERGSELFTPPTSNGLGAGPDLDSAVLGGLLEVVERDAFLIAWLNRLPASEVDLAGPRAPWAPMVEHYRRFGVELRVFDVTTDLPIAVMLCLAIDRSGEGPAAVAGLGSHLDPPRAIEKAVMEVCQVRPGVARTYALSSPEDRLAGYEDVETLEDHSAFFTDGERLGELAFLLDTGRRVAVDELPARSTGDAAGDLTRAVADLAAAGHQVVYRDLTTPDLAGIAVRAARVLVPGLQPIHFGHRQERLGGDRLYEVPRALGHAERRRRPDEINPCPHPLA